MRFGKLIDGALHQAPRTLTVSGRTHYHPGPDLYRAAVYLPIVDTPRPGIPEGAEMVPHYVNRWEEKEGQILRVWVETEPPEPEVPEPTLSDRVATLEARMAGLVSVEYVPSDKVGYDFKNVYVQGELVRQEYILSDDSTGTADDPIPWAPDLPLRTNAHYVYSGIRKIWLGDDGVTADWDDLRWEVF